MQSAPSVAEPTVQSGFAMAPDKEVVGTGIMRATAVSFNSDFLGLVDLVLRVLRPSEEEERLARAASESDDEKQREAGEEALQVLRYEATAHHELSVRRDDLARWVACSGGARVGMAIRMHDLFSDNDDDIYARNPSARLRSPWAVRECAESVYKDSGHEGDEEIDAEMRARFEEMGPDPLAALFYCRTLDMHHVLRRADEETSVRLWKMLVGMHRSSCVISVFARFPALRRMVALMPVSQMAAGNTAAMVTDLLYSAGTDRRKLMELEDILAEYAKEGGADKFEEAMRGVRRMTRALSEACRVDERIQEAMEQKRASACAVIRQSLEHEGLGGAEHVRHEEAVPRALMAFERADSQAMANLVSSGMISEAALDCCRRSFLDNKLRGTDFSLQLERVSDALPDIASMVREQPGSIDDVSAKLGALMLPEEQARIQSMLRQAADMTTAAHAADAANDEAAATGGDTAPDGAGAEAESHGAEADSHGAEAPAASERPSE